MDDIRVLRIYLEELVDRALRFYLHINEVQREYFDISPGVINESFSHEKPYFLDSLRSCTETVLRTATQLSIESQNGASAGQVKSFFHIARHAFICINQLHEQGLIHLPRPSEPIELRAYP
jgi:hypothetical protein